MNIFKLTEKQLTNWKSTRKKSRFLYYIKWGLLVCIFFTIIMYIYNIHILNFEFDFSQFVILSGVSFIGGLILGIINWSAMEYGYKISREKE